MRGFSSEEMKPDTERNPGEGRAATPSSCRILHLLEGAKEAKGITVIIDVFRAFSVECYLYEMGATLVRPVGTVEEARALHEAIPGSVLVGERQGIRCEGFDFGNSPSQIVRGRDQIAGRVAIHTTSAGTQGIVNAAGASEILTGSLVNAKAVAAYIRKRLKETREEVPGSGGSALREEHAGEQIVPVSLVAMGLSAKTPAAEDELCAEYIRAYIEGKEIPPSFERRRRELKNFDGKRFFDPKLQEHFPEEDYHMCIEESAFAYVLRVARDELGFYSEKIPVGQED